jgi:hypothetical protein
MPNAKDPVIGATIVTVRPMTKAEADVEGWSITGRHGAPFVVVLSTGAVLYPSRDDEGNGPGALFGQYQGQPMSFAEREG